MGSFAPIFGDELPEELTSLVYDSSKTYEVEETVIPSLSNPSIYTALKAVPVSTAPESDAGERINTEYWANEEEFTAKLADENSAEISDVPDDEVVDTGTVEDLPAPTEETDDGGNDNDNGGNDDGSNDGGDSGDGGQSINSARLIAVNVRGTIGTGDDKRIMGFRLDGSASVLLRGVGPALAEYDLDPTTLLPDPKLTLFKYKDATEPSKGYDRVSSGDNDNYSTNSNASSIDSVRQTLSLVIPSNPLQSMSMPTLSEGFYTSHIEDASLERSGIGWAGVDLADPSATTSSFLHVSARGLVQTSEYMFGGFEIKGEGTRTLYIRGRGPSLADFNVPGVMPDPILKVFKYDNEPGGSSTQIAENDDFGSNVNSSSILSFSSSLYGWPSLNAKDPGLILELAEGYYTIQLISLSTENNGVGWIGIDDVTGL